MWYAACRAPRPGEPSSHAKLQSSGSTPTGLVNPFTVRLLTSSGAAGEAAAAVRAGTGGGEAAAFRAPRAPRAPAAITAPEVSVPLTRKVRRSKGFMQS